MLLITLYKVVLTFESVDETLNCDIQMKAIEQHFPVHVLFIDVVYYPVQDGSNFTSVDETRKCRIQMKAIEQHFPVYVLFIDAVYHALHGGSNF